MTYRLLRSGIYGCRCQPLVPILVRWRALGLAALGALALTVPAQAASLGVSPLLVEFSAAEKTAGVRVSNLDPEHAVNVQVRLFRWQQVDGADVHSETDAITLSPPITRIEPGRTNLVRLVLTGTPPAHGEASYRLILDELPAPETSGVSMVIRQSLPVFVAASAVQPAAPEWQVERVNAGDGHGSGYRVSVHNRGERRLRLSGLTLANEHGGVLAQSQGLVGYALGGSQMQFLILDVEGGADPTAEVWLTAQAESGELSAGPLSVRAGG